MRIYEAADLKSFTTGLFGGDIFDGFLLREAEIVTFNSFKIDGRIRKEFYSSEEADESEEYSYWRDIRPVCFNIIKGRRLPVSFRIILKLARKDKAEWTEASGTVSGSDGDFYMNIRYENRKLRITGGMASAMPDLAAADEWDLYILNFLKKNNIAAESV